MSYFEGFVLAVPEANREAFRAQADEAAGIFRRHGALRVTECWGDDVPRGKTTDFWGAVKAEEGEAVVFSFIEWPDRAARDTGMEAVRQEMETLMKDNPMPFDGRRMIYGGFEAIVDQGG